MDYITLSILLGFREKKDIKKFRDWLGLKCPSQNYSDLAAKFVADSLTASDLPPSRIIAIERFSIDIDHSANQQWDGEYSELEQIGKMQWKLGNAKLKKGDRVWLRLSGQWIQVIVDYSSRNGYSLLVEPEGTHLQLSTDMKMRWQF